MQKGANGFVLSGALDPADSVVAEDARYPVFERSRDGTTTPSIYRPAARFVPDRSPRAPVLDLDVVPVAGDKFRVVFKGKPLAKAKIEVITPSGWGRECIPATTASSPSACHGAVSMCSRSIIRTARPASAAMRLMTS